MSDDACSKDLVSGCGVQGPPSVTCVYLLGAPTYLWRPRHVVLVDGGEICFIVDVVVFGSMLILPVCKGVD